MVLPSSLTGRDGAEGTIGHTGAAVDALLRIDDVDLLGRAGDGLHGAVLPALAAALAFLRVDGGVGFFLVADGTVVVHYMGQIFIPEILQRALDGLAGALSQAAQGCLADGVRQLLQQVQILQCALVVDDPVQDLQHPLGALPAGDALAAGLLLCKLHEEPGRLHHAGVLEIGRASCRERV